MNWGDFQAGFAAGNVLVFPPQINVLQAKKKFEILDAVRALWVPSVAAGRAALDPWHCPGHAGMPKMGAEQLHREQIQPWIGFSGCRTLLSLLCAHSKAGERTRGINCFGKVQKERVKPFFGFFGGG